MTKPNLNGTFTTKVPTLKCRAIPGSDETQRKTAQSADTADVPQNCAETLSTK